MTHRPPDDPVAFRFFNEVGIIEQLARNAFERVMPAGLTLPQFNVLNHFVRLGGERSPLALARAFQVTKGAMTNTLQRLEAQGLIAVRPDPSDGRGKLVSITPQGEARREQAVAALAPLIAALSTQVDEAEMAEALPVLQQVRAHLDAARDAARDAPENPPVRQTVRQSVQGS